MDTSTRLMSGFTKEQAKGARELGRQWARDRARSNSTYTFFMLEDALVSYLDQDRAVATSLAYLTCREAARELNRLQEKT